MLKKSQKRAWDGEQDRILIELISEIGPRQWEMISEQVPNRSGKQCRERWNNQLNPLLKKSPWSIEEGWTLFILQRSAKNRWAEISNVVLGRPDNSIKNYWNSVLRYKQNELVDNLDKYLNSCLEIEKPDDVGVFKKETVKRLLKFFIRQSQKQFLDHLNSKRQDISFDKESSTNSKVRSFKLRLLDKALILHHSLLKEEDVQNNGGSSNSDGVSNPNSAAAIEMRKKLDMPNLKEMVATSESGEFYQVYLSNQLCQKIQLALLDQRQIVSEEDQPPQLHLLESICLKKQDFSEKIQFFNEVGNYYQEGDDEVGQNFIFHSQGDQILDEQEAICTRQDEVVFENQQQKNQTVQEETYPLLQNSANSKNIKTIEPSLIQNLPPKFIQGKSVIEEVAPVQVEQPKNSYQLPKMAAEEEDKQAEHAQVNINDQSGQQFDDGNDRAQDNLMPKQRPESKIQTMDIDQQQIQEHSQHLSQEKTSPPLSRDLQDHSSDPVSMKHRSALQKNIPQQPLHPQRQESNNHNNNYQTPSSRTVYHNESSSNIQLGSGYEHQVSSSPQQNRSSQNLNQQSLSSSQKLLRKRELKASEKQQSKKASVKYQLDIFSQQSRREQLQNQQHVQQMSSSASQAQAYNHSQYHQNHYGPTQAQYPPHLQAPSSATSNLSQVAAVRTLPTKQLQQSQQHSQHPMLRKSKSLALPPSMQDGSQHAAPAGIGGFYYGHPQPPLHSHHPHAAPHSPFCMSQYGVGFQPHQGHHQFHHHHPQAATTFWQHQHQHQHLLQNCMYQQSHPPHPPQQHQHIHQHQQPPRQNHYRYLAVTPQQHEHLQQQQQQLTNPPLQHHQGQRKNSYGAVAKLISNSVVRQRSLLSSVETKKSCYNDDAASKQAPQSTTINNNTKSLSCFRQQLPPPVVVCTPPTKNPLRRGQPSSKQFESSGRQDQLLAAENSFHQQAGQDRLLRSSVGSHQPEEWTVFQSSEKNGKNHNGQHQKTQNKQVISQNKNAAAYSSSASVVQSSHNNNFANGNPTLKDQKSTPRWDSQQALHVYPRREDYSPPRIVITPLNNSKSSAEPNRKLQQLVSGIQQQNHKNHLGKQSLLQTRFKDSTLSQLAMPNSIDRTPDKTLEIISSVFVKNFSEQKKKSFIPKRFEIDQQIVTDRLISDQGGQNYHLLKDQDMNQLQYPSISKKSVLLTPQQDEQYRASGRYSNSVACSSPNRDNDQNADRLHESRNEQSDYSYGADGARLDDECPPPEHQENIVVYQQPQLLAAIVQSQTIDAPELPPPVQSSSRIRERGLSFVSEVDHSLALLTPLKRPRLD